MVIHFTLFEYGGHPSKFPLQWENACNDRSLIKFSKGWGNNIRGYFKSLHGILSNPVAFLTFSFLRRLRTSLIVGIFSENVEYYA